MGGFLVTVVSLVVGSTGSRHRPSVVVAQRLQRAGYIVVVHGLSCFATCGIFLDQGLKSPALQGGFLTTGPRGKSQHFSND